ncbi:hypothetical protein C8R46DRAFT_1207048 [Mycena filopes]|nr:hypothetical protein C8R46DRAFT_1207048 [Mycena filopes]
MASPRLLVSASSRRRLVSPAHLAFSFLFVTASFPSARLSFLPRHEGGYGEYERGVITTTTSTNLSASPSLPLFFPFLPFHGTRGHPPRRRVYERLRECILRGGDCSILPALEGTFDLFPPSPSLRQAVPFMARGDDAGSTRAVAIRRAIAVSVSNFCVTKTTRRSQGHIRVFLDCLFPLSSGCLFFHAMSCNSFFWRPTGSAETVRRCPLPAAHLVLFVPLSFSPPERHEERMWVVRPQQLARPPQRRRVYDRFHEGILRAGDCSTVPAAGGHSRLELLSLLPLFPFVPVFHATRGGWAPYERSHSFFWRLPQPFDRPPSAVGAAF